MRSGPKIEVPTVLSKTQIEFFVENGYLAVPDLISSSEIAELRADTLKLARGSYPCELFATGRGTSYQMMKC